MTRHVTESQLRQMGRIAGAIAVALDTACTKLVKLLFAVWLIANLFELLPWGRDSTDAGEWGPRSGMAIKTDALTRCQYLVASGGGITPRLDGLGEQLGCQSAVTP